MDCDVVAARVIWGVGKRISVITSSMNQISIWSWDG
jgi:hypothetical protein